MSDALGTPRPIESGMLQAARQVQRALSPWARDASTGTGRFRPAGRNSGLRANLQRMVAKAGTRTERSAVIASRIGSITPDSMDQFVDRVQDRGPRLAEHVARKYAPQPAQGEGSPTARPDMPLVETGAGDIREDAASDAPTMSAAQVLESLGGRFARSPEQAIQRSAAPEQSDDESEPRSLMSEMRRRFSGTAEAPAAAPAKPADVQRSPFPAPQPAAVDRARRRSRIEEIPAARPSPLEPVAREASQPDRPVAPAVPARVPAPRPDVVRRKIDSARQVSLPVDDGAVPVPREEAAAKAGGTPPKVATGSPPPAPGRPVVGSRADAPQRPAAAGIQLRPSRPSPVARALPAPSVRRVMRAAQPARGSSPDAPSVGTEGSQPAIAPAPGVLADEARMPATPPPAEPEDALQSGSPASLPIVQSARGQIQRSEVEHALPLASRTGPRDPPAQLPQAASQAVSAQPAGRERAPEVPAKPAQPAVAVQRVRQSLTQAVRRVFFRPTAPNQPSARPGPIQRQAVPPAVAAPSPPDRPDVRGSDALGGQAVRAAHVSPATPALAAHAAAAPVQRSTGDASPAPGPELPDAPSRAGRIVEAIDRAGSDLPLVQRSATQDADSSATAPSSSAPVTESVVQRASVQGGPPADIPRVRLGNAPEAGAPAPEATGATEAFTPRAAAWHEQPAPAQGPQLPLVQRQELAPPGRDIAERPHVPEAPLDLGGEPAARTIRRALPPSDGGAVPDAHRAPVLRQRMDEPRAPGSAGPTRSDRPAPGAPLQLRRSRAQASAETVQRQTAGAATETQAAGLRGTPMPSGQAMATSTRAAVTPAAAEGRVPIVRGSTLGGGAREREKTARGAARTSSAVASPIAVLTLRQATGQARAAAAVVQRSPETRTPLPLAARPSVIQRAESAKAAANSGHGASKAKDGDDEDKKAAKKGGRGSHSRAELDALARDVYPLLRRLLIVERERLRGT